MTCRMRSPGWKISRNLAKAKKLLPW